MRRLTAADYRHSRWKNGAGETTELMVLPAGASLDDFVWRISMASMTSDAAFSVFPGIDRSLVVLEGNGFKLRLPDGELLLREGDAPVRFAGEAQASAVLTDGVTTDFNVMTRREQASHCLRAAAAGDIIRVDADFGAIFATTSVRVLAADGPVSVASGELLVLDVDTSALVEEGRGFAVTIAINGQRQQGRRPQPAGQRCGYGLARQLHRPPPSHFGA